MKRALLILLSVLIIIGLFAGCSKDKEKEPSLIMPTKLDTVEYTLYQNIFFNDKISEYADKETTKTGTFTTLYDAYNNTVRYYVWGYNDNTKCCDWQWEIKFDDAKNLPNNGALVVVKGVFEENENALDGLWIVNPEVTVETNYKSGDYDVDMLTMSNTLERVEAANIQNMPDYFEGKTVGFYGRMKNDTEIEDAYYDNSWSIKVSGDFTVPAYGTTVIAKGTIKNGAIEGVTLSDNTQY